jgi:hypothetical protein
MVVVDGKDIFSRNVLALFFTDVHQTDEADKSYLTGSA